MNKKWIKIGILVFILFIFSIAFSLINIGNERIYSNISIQQVDVAGKTQNEVEESLNKLLREKNLNQINLKHNDFQTTISFEQLNIDYDVNKAIESAYGKGRTGNILTNNYFILFSYFIKSDIPLNYNIDEGALNNVISDIESKLPDVKAESSYYVDGDNLIIKSGKKGVVIKKEDLKNRIKSVISNIQSFDNEIDIPVEEIEPEDIDIESIVADVKEEPKDAFISGNPLEIHIEKKGIDITNSIDEIKEMLKEHKDEYLIPLKITEPSVTVASFGDKAFTDKLSTFSTNYDASNINRNNNLVLAAEKLNGVIVNPGEEFSYNKTIGERTISAGFKEAKAYANGDIVLDVGGGICQLSSTLYNAVLLSNLDVVERHSHYFKTAYVAAGRDATVSWGVVDFRFNNTRKYPIKIEAKAEDGVVTVNLLGIKQDDDLTVIIDSKETSVIEREAEKVKSGEKTREGENGCTSETYKTLLKNGVIVSKTLVSKDTYNALSKRTIEE